MGVRFILPEPLYSNIPKPLPASECMPEWYKDTPFNQRDKFGKSYHESTVRGCMPFLNALSMGWILRAPQDVSIRSDGNELDFNYKKLPDGQHAINNFEFDTLPVIPDSISNKVIPIKINSQWFIDGHEGAKAWVMPPRNRFRSNEYEHMIFASGVYNINSTYIDSGIIAFLEITPNLSIHIDAGTPIAQVMLFDDNGFINNATVEKMTQEDIEKKESKEVIDAVDNDAYKNRYWEPVGRARKPENNSTSECPMGFGSSDTKD